jgi:hypothetical protein
MSIRFEIRKGVGGAGICGGIGGDLGISWEWVGNITANSLANSTEIQEELSGAGNALGSGIKVTEVKNLLLPW